MAWRVSGVVICLRTIWNGKAKMRDKPKFHTFSLSRSFGSNGSEPYAPLRVGKYSPPMSTFFWTMVLKTYLDSYPNWWKWDFPCLLRNSPRKLCQNSNLDQCGLQGWSLLLTQQWALILRQVGGGEHFPVFLFVQQHHQHHLWQQSSQNKDPISSRWGRNHIPTLARAPCYLRALIKSFKMSLF